MSRSKKKNPFRAVGRVKAGEMKQWKTLANRRVRKSDIEPIDGAAYKKIYGSRNDTWCSPIDGPKRYTEGELTYKEMGK